MKGFSGSQTNLTQAGHSQEHSSHFANSNAADTNTPNEKEQVHSSESNSSEVMVSSSSEEKSEPKSLHDSQIAQSGDLNGGCINSVDRNVDEPHLNGNGNVFSNGSNSLGHVGFSGSDQSGSHEKLAANVSNIQEPNDIEAGPSDNIPSVKSGPVESHGSAGRVNLVGADVGVVLDGGIAAENMVS